MKVKERGSEKLKKNFGSIGAHMRTSVPVPSAHFPVPTKGGAWKFYLLRRGGQPGGPIVSPVLLLKCLPVTASWTLGNVPAGFPASALS